MTSQRGLPAPFVGQVSDAFAEEAFLANLSDVREWVDQPGRILSSGRNQVVVRKNVSVGEGQSVDLVIKSFGRQSSWKDAADMKNGTRALRSWSAAERLVDQGVGTPRPVACLDAWKGKRLVESYYVSVWEPDATDLRREIIRLLRKDPVCWKVMNLLEAVSAAVRSMHDSGVMHRDLGNQNILLSPEIDGRWESVSFVDLNRAKLCNPLTLKQKARDLSRIHLPSDLLRVFYEMYFDARPSTAFRKWDRGYRRRYAIHSCTRKFRHPFRESQASSDAGSETAYPDYRDVWIWDHRSAQPINVLRSRERNRIRPWSDAVRIFISTVVHAPGVLAAYRRNLRFAYSRPVELRGRIGMSIEPAPGKLDEELELLGRLGPVPVLIRFYAHTGPDGWSAAMSLAERAHRNGHSVAAAFVQSRDAVLDPSSWDAMLETVLDRLHPILDWVELGHAINRVKWGAWTHRERVRILSPVTGLQSRYPGVKFAGPAAIDFDVPYTVSILGGLPSGAKLDAMSHHLYVDRRGAPENHQGPFDTVRKCAMTRAAGQASGRCGDGLIVSEVNWPLSGTGVYSPVVSPYDTPGPRKNDPGVDENEYGIYMIRYVLISLCSGLVQRVYWWRLVARGFGLVDDTNPDSPAPRPAYLMLRHFLDKVGQSTFCKFENISPDVHIYSFLQPDESQCVVAYRTGESAPWTPPFTWDRAGTVTGETVSTNRGVIELSGSPIYFTIATRQER